MFSNLFSLQGIVGLLGGGGILAYILLAIFFPSAILIIAPMLQAIVNAIAAVVAFLWTGFLYLAQNVAAVLLVVFLCIAWGGYTAHKARTTTYAEVHHDYTLTKKSTITTSPVYNFFDNHLHRTEPKSVPVKTKIDNHIETLMRNPLSGQ